MNAIRSSEILSLDPRSDPVDDQLEAIKHLIPLREARKLFPPSRSTRSKHIHISTISRWISRGARAPNGERVKLRALRLGWAWMTTRAWIHDFVLALTAADDDRPASVPCSSRTPSERRRAIEMARRELAELGVGA